MAVARVGWGVLALCGALGLAVFALRHPFGVMAGGAIAVAFVVLMSVRRDAWLLVGAASNQQRLDTWSRVPIARCLQAPKHTCTRTRTCAL